MKQSLCIKASTHPPGAIRSAAKCALGDARFSWLPPGTLVVQAADEDGMLGGVDGVVRINSVLARGVVDRHTT